MKKFLAVLVAVVMLVGFVSAQNTQNLGTKAGDKSLNFVFSGLGDFKIGPTGPSNGLGISYFLGSNSALRVGLQIERSSTTDPYNDFSANATNPGTDGSSSIFTLALGGDYLMYMAGATSRVRPYIGAGGNVNMISSTINPKVTNDKADDEDTEISTGIFGFGLTGIVGAEFYLYPEISLSAEYNLGLFNMSSNSDRTTKFEKSKDFVEKRGGNTTLFDFGTTALQIHIYF